MLAIRPVPVFQAQALLSKRGNGSPTLFPPALKKANRAKGETTDPPGHRAAEFLLGAFRFQITLPLLETNR
jgi:hypothetical protein